MDSKIEKRNKVIHIIEKWFIIGIILFVVVQLTALSIINFIVPPEDRVSEESFDNYQEEYIGHWYCGTFFINMEVPDHFENKGVYKDMLSKYNNDIRVDICEKGGHFLGIVGFILILIAAYKERKNKLTEGKTPIIIALSGTVFLLYKIFEELDLFVDSTYWSKYTNSFLKTIRYYPQLHLFILPVLIILLGLVLRHIQLKKNTKVDNIIKAICIFIVTVGFTFILYRFGVRVYELIMVLLNNNINIRLPYYYYIFDLPKSFATTNLSYIKLVVLRFIKDLGVFISSGLSIVLFVKIIKSYINNEIMTDENNKRYKIMFISLFISSIIFNLLGLLEVRLFNTEFLYQYSEATYTIALRSLTDPLLYALFIYSFKHYIEVGFVSLNKK